MVEKIIENGLEVVNEEPRDTIIIEFKPDGSIVGESTRNLITAEFQIISEDSIHISTIGGTEVMPTPYEKKIRELMPTLEYIQYDTSTFSLENAKSNHKIIFQYIQ